MFDYTDSPEKMFVIENEVGKKGILSAKVIHYHSQKDEEDCIISVAMNDEGQIMPDDFVEKLMSISGRITNVTFPEIDESRLKAEMDHKQDVVSEYIALRDKEFINDESEKIERWAEDQTFTLEEEVRNVKKQIKECEREFRNEKDDHRRRELQSEIISLQRTLKQKRRELFDVEDEIMARRNELIAEIDNSLNKSAEEEYLFTIAWQVV